MRQQMNNLDSSYAEIMAGKSACRENHVIAVRMASSGMLDEAAQRIKDVMRKPQSARRQRIAPPAFAV